jgi:hypothetical protein
MPLQMFARISCSRQLGDTSKIAKVKVWKKDGNQGISRIKAEHMGVVTAFRHEIKGPAK